MKVRCHELCQVISGLNKRFSPFHLAACYCGAPVWQQPCPICGYYPMYGNTNSALDKDGCTLEMYVKTIEKAGNVLEWYLRRMEHSSGDKPNFDNIREDTKDYQWPDPEAIWYYFRTHDDYTGEMRSVEFLAKEGYQPNTKEEIIAALKRRTGPNTPHDYRHDVHKKKLQQQDTEHAH